MTLLLLALATAATTATAVVCVRKSSQAADAQVDLQRRWGIYSCRSVLLPQAEKLLASRTGRDLRQSISLGNQQFEIVVADEEAKLNVNALLAELPQADAERVIRQVVRAEQCSTPVSIPRLAAVPEPPDMPRGVGKRRFIEAIDQLSPSATPEELIGQTGRPGMVALLTCRGDGRLQFRRASRGLLSAVCSQALDAIAIEHLYQGARKNPNATLAEALSGLNLTAEQRAGAELLLTDKSEAYSAWVTCDDGRRRWHEFSISESGGPVLSYRW